jgi:predicted metalloprotease
MRWQIGRRSANIEDRRGMGVPVGIAGGGIGAVVLVVLGLLFGVDPALLTQIAAGGGGGADGYGASRPPAPGEDRLADFVSAVLADTEDTWTAALGEEGREYREPKLVLFSGSVRSACGFGDAAMGPFYCPADEKAYLDLAFFRDMERKLGASGDFAQAYVIAHEIGHHVQNLLGISGRVSGTQQRLDEASANALSVRLELQADCFAGIWAHRAEAARHIIEPGDVEEALGAASAVGDDRLQRRSRGYVVPESFTHGSSEQRMRWFRRGLESGSLRACDTFGGEAP